MKAQAVKSSYLQLLQLNRILFDATKLVRFLTSTVSKNPVGFAAGKGRPQSEFFLNFLKLTLSPYLTCSF